MATIYEYRTDIEYPEWMKSLPPEVEEGELRDPRVIWEEMQLDNKEHEAEISRQEEEKPYKKAWQNLKAQRKSKSENFTLTLAGYIEVKDQNCHFCDKEPGLGQITIDDTPRKLSNMRVGKIDPTAIYSDDNVIPVCEFCSKRRQSKTVDEFWASEGGVGTTREEKILNLQKARAMKLITGS